MNNIEQNSDVVPLESTNNVHNETATTTFEDTGKTVSIGHGISVPVSVVTKDLDLIEFLSRPVKIAAGSAVGTTTNLNPFNLYFSNAAVARKIANYKYIRCTLNVRYSESAMPFVYGRRIMAIEPAEGLLGNYDTVAALSNLPHVLIDPTKSNPYVISLPFLRRANYYKLYSITSDSIYNLIIRDIVSYVRSDSAAAPEVQFSLHAWLTDVELVTPVATSIIHESSEFKGVLSHPMSVVSSAAKTLGQIPRLAPLSNTLEVAADSAAKFASLFGFSKPVQLEPPVPFADNPHFNMTATTYIDTCQKLTKDPKQGIVVSTATMDGSEVDNLAFSNFHDRFSFIRTWTWTQSDAVDTLIASFPVTPLFFKAQTSSKIVTIPSCAIPGMHFKYWKGSMIYTLTMICSKFHKGRLRVLWSPNELSFPLTEPLSNQVESVVIDVSTDSELTFTVNWGKADPYATCFPVSTATTTNFDYTGNNGYIYIFVHQELVAPLSSADAYIGMSMKAHKNMQYAMPSSQALQNYTPTSIGTAANFVAINSIATPYPPYGTYATTISSSNPAGPIQYESGALTEVVTKPKTFSFNETKEEDDTQMIQAGESHASFRTMCKSYYPLYEGYFVAGGGVVAGNKSKGYFSLNLIPYVPFPYAAGQPAIDTYQSPITWMQRNFLGFRGSVRYKVVFCTPITAATVCRIRGSAPRYALCPSGRQAIFDGNGVALDIKNNSITFELPYESTLRYQYNSQALVNTAKSANLDRAMVHFDFIWTENLIFEYKVYVSLGEDANFVGYVGFGDTYVQDIRASNIE